MTDQLTLVDGEPQPRAQCHNDRESLLDSVSYFAIGFVLVGLVFSAIGFLYPRDLERDPSASAAENERVEADYMQLTNALNSIIIAGMILTGLGGLILSGIFTNTVVCRECQRRDDENRTLTSQQTTSREESPAAHRPITTATNSADSNVNYGTVSQASPNAQ
ncbi:transmembrane protein 74-like [Babylonia areolata]|uniref:transmembrane protein 74-like n=1 Tax=Babylonia areolata TaxID=304850 RepID=UPI003FD1E253